MGTRFTYRYEPFGSLCYDSLNDKLFNNLDICQLLTENTKIIDNRYNNMPPISAPITAFFEITGKCNSGCVHCLTRQNECATDLSLADIKSIIDKLYEAGIFNIKITGGEPFYRNDIFDILDYIEYKSINFIIYTNGTFINREVSYNLKKYKHLLKIRVSIDGLKDTNDAIRGKGMYDAALDALTLLSLYELPCEANFTICYTNYNEILEVASILEESKINVKINIGTLKISHSVLEHKQLIIPEDKTLLVMCAVKKQINCSSSIIPLKLLPDLYYEIFGSSFGCPAGRISMSINSCGDVTGCGLFFGNNELLCGNLLNQSFRDIWDCKEMNMIRTLNENVACLLCEHYKNKCTGACRGNALNYFDDIAGRDINCDTYKIDYVASEK